MDTYTINFFVKKISRLKVKNARLKDKIQSYEAEIESLNQRLTEETNRKMYHFTQVEELKKAIEQFKNKQQ